MKQIPKFDYTYLGKISSGDVEQALSSHPKLAADYAKIEKISGIISKFTAIFSLIFLPILGFNLVFLTFAVSLTAAARFMPTLVAKGLLRHYLRFFLFAEKNGLAYVAAPEKKAFDRYNYRPEGISPLFEKTGSIFETGHGRASRHLLGNKNQAVFGYKYTTGSGKHKQTHEWSVGVYQLDKTLPHVLLDAKGNNFWKFSNMPQWFSGDQKIDIAGLENYNVYAPDGYDVDALSFITPELIEKLASHSANTEFEIVGNILYLYQKSPFGAEIVRPIFETLAKIGSEIDDNTRSYRDARLDLSQSGQIATQGRRLKRSRATIIVPVIIFIIWIILQIIPS